MPFAKVPLHLRPATEVAERVLLPGDPQRSFSIASALLEDSRVFNLRRGLWGYSGRAPDGLPVTVQASGMGGPSAAIVVEELAWLGARTFIRIGTCGAISATLGLGELVVAGRVFADDGTSAALDAGEWLEPDRGLTSALVSAAETRGGRGATVASTDLFYDDRPRVVDRWTARGAEVVEMEAAAVLRVAERRGARAACLLAVTDLLGAETSDLGSDRRRVDDSTLDGLGLRLGEVALEALERVVRAGAAGAGGRPAG